MLFVDGGVEGWRGRTWRDLLVAPEETADAEEKEWCGVLGGLV